MAPAQRPGIPTARTGDDEAVGDGARVTSPPRRVTAVAEPLVSPVGSHNEWDPLEEIVVGRLDGATIPSGHPVVTCNIPPWAARLQGLAAGFKRWAGSVTKATHDQWALARRGQLAHIQSLEAGVRTVAHRLSLPVGHKGSKRAPGG